MLVACTPPLPAPHLDVSNASLSITASTPVRTLKVRNTGEPGSLLDWSVVSSSRALVVSPASGRLEAGSERRLDVTVDRSIVPIADRIEETLTLKTNGGESDIFVTFSVVGTGLGACGTYPSSFGSSNSSVPAFTQTVGRPYAANEPYAMNELLVQFRAPVTSQVSLTQGATSLGSLGSGQPKYTALDKAALDKEISAVSRSVAYDYGFSLKKQATFLRPALVEIPAGETPAGFAKRLAADSRVLYAEPNYYLELLKIPNDPRYGEQWHLSDFGLPQAWDLETGVNDVVISVIDSGVDIDHQDLKAKVLPGCDFYTRPASADREALSGDNDPNPGIPNGGRSEHGTHVAGVAAALGDNATGGAGVAYGAGIKILPVKIFDDSGGGAQISHLIDALYWSAGLDVPEVASNPFPADIINMSLGADPADIPEELQSIRRAAAAVSAQGVLMFAASANNGFSDRIYVPAADPNVVAVGSVDASLERSGFSNYNFSGPTVDIMAPGGFGNGGCPAGNILSTFTDDDYGCLNGTSMSSPFVAAVAALVWSQNPDLNAAQVREQLFATTLYDEAFMNPQEYGRGIVCADKALGAATLCGQ